VAAQREPDVLDAARVLALGVVALGGAMLLAIARVPATAAGVLMQLSFVAVPLGYARWAGLRPFAANGFVPLPLRRLVLVLAASLGSLWLLNGLTHVQTRMIRKAGFEKKAQEEEESIREGIVHAQDQGAAPALALLVLIPPLCEETFFRGLLFRGLLARFGPAMALGATSVLFALLHRTVVQTGLMVFLGCYFGLLVWLTGSLWASLIAHGVNNLAVLTLMWIYKGRLPEFTGPWWMYALSGAVFALAMTLLVLDRKTGKT
jgi:membrane protease YdiL (CAAX protease family)